MADRVEKTVHLVREFDCPRSLLFELFTRPEHLNRWWGPECFTAAGAEVDLRIGGAWKVKMCNAQFGDSWVVGEYREIDPPARLVFTSNAPGPDGALLLEGLTTLVFEDLGERSRLTVDATAGGPAFMQPALNGMEQGWSEQLDKLGRYAMEPV